MSAVDVVVDGRRVRLTNLDKVFYPKVGFTKAHVLDYYRKVSPALLPHLKGRALTLKRYPDGVEGSFFYEKSCPTHRPDWVRTAPIWSEGRGEDIDFCVIDDLSSLMWAVNLADLELHTYLARAEAPNEPTAMVFDLDPGPGTDLVDCARVGIRLRDLLKSFGLESYPKTSGSKGMQVYVPFNVPTTFEQTKPLARAMGEILERETPRSITTNMSKAERKNRVFIDWSQNDDHKTTVCAYSLRAKEEPTVSTPLLWSEVDEAASAKDAGALRFLPEAVLARVESRGDLFDDVLTKRQSVPTLT